MEVGLLGMSLYVHTDVVWRFDMGIHKLRKLDIFMAATPFR